MTVHSMVEMADRGDIVGKPEIDIAFHYTARDVYLRVLDVGTEGFREVLSTIKERRVDPVRQRHSLATYGKRRTPGGGLIDWRRSAFDIYNMVQGLTHPYPGAFTYFRGKKFIVWQSRLYENTSRLTEPGRVVEGLQTDGIRVAAGAGSLVLSSVQLEGEEEVDASRFF